MQIQVNSKSKSLLGVTDLTLVANLRRGLIPALDSRTYESRLRLVLRTLNAFRSNAAEVQPESFLVDVIDEIRAIHSFRVAISGRERRQVVLAVAFDGGWESYMRQIWRDLGPFLDLIFCNCEGYPISRRCNFAEYTAWVRSAQVDTEFFYTAGSLTVNDLHYLRREQQRSLDRRVVPSSQPSAPADPALVLKASLPALMALYRMADMFPKGENVNENDNELLLNAARLLLPQLSDLIKAEGTLPAGPTPSAGAALQWLEQGIRPRNRKQPDPPHRVVEQPWEDDKVQAGIIKSFNGSHSCMLLVELKDAHAAAAMLKHLKPDIVSARAHGEGKGRGGKYANVAFTPQGLQVAGVPKSLLDEMPLEFREGMAARASILGDIRYNHPSVWRLPEYHAPVDTAAGAPARVELSCVHAVVQYTYRGEFTRHWLTPSDANYPLADKIAGFKQLADQGVRILSLQPMQRFADVQQPGHEGGKAAKEESLPREHFGFIDGISQPKLRQAGHAADGDTVAPGDLLLGYENALEDPPRVGRLWSNSTFLVVRKLRQDVAALDAVLKRSGLDIDEAKTYLMGRRPDGSNLIDKTAGNNFGYVGDDDGEKCPLQSHVRRANPRREGKDLRKVPRILRRGMSYGPPADESTMATERGLMFMAYNASIGEQFEVIQSWLSGGNSSGEKSYSALRDPFIGVPQPADPCTYVYTIKDAQGISTRRELDLSSARPFVSLEWGLYAFVPSLPALAELCALAEEATSLEGAPTDPALKQKKETQRAMQLAGKVQMGAMQIASLRQIEQTQGFDAAATQWKIALEDLSSRMSGAAEAIWAAIRQLHGGALRTPYGVLVCSKSLVMAAFENKGRSNTATGYAERMKASFGEIFLGMDNGSEYQRQADAVNKAIQTVSKRQAFDSAHAHAAAVVSEFAGLAMADKEITVEVKDIVDAVLARISKEFFSLPDGEHVVAGAWREHVKGAPTCPGHFHSPSRYMFQPNPGEVAVRAGQEHGRSLNGAVRRFVDAHRANESVPGGVLAEKLFAAIPIPIDPEQADAENERLARTLIGVMMGFLPTVDGNLRSTLYEWVNDRSLWDHQAAYLANQGGDALARAEAALLPPLRRTMQLRPVPELTWRTALTRHSIGQVEVNPGERIVLSIVSATQECLSLDDLDLYPVFGGDRSAPTHPTHACPGYAMAVGVLLGMLAGLLEHKQLRPAPSPLSLRLCV